MQRIIAISLLVVDPTAFSYADEFRDLFNGKDLSGWIVEGATKQPNGEPIWSVKDGLITATANRSGYGFLRFDPQQFGDFTVHVEYRFQTKESAGFAGNSGIGVRTPVYDPKRSDVTRPSYASYEIQLLDDAGKPPNKHSTGSLYRYAAPTANPAKGAPEWNTLDIECVGPRIKVTLNTIMIVNVDQRDVADLDPKEKGKKQIPAPKEKPLKGFLALQSHTGTVEFRKVQVREIRGSSPERSD